MVSSQLCGNGCVPTPPQLINIKRLLAGEGCFSREIWDQPCAAGRGQQMLFSCELKGNTSFFLCQARDKKCSVLEWYCWGCDPGRLEAKPAFSELSLSPVLLGLVPSFTQQKVQWSCTWVQPIAQSPHFAGVREWLLLAVLFLDH